MKEEVLSYFREKKLLVSPDVLEKILGHEDPLKFCEEVAARVEGPFVTIGDLEREDEEEEVVVYPSAPFSPIAKEIPSRFKEFEKYDVTGNSLSEGKVENFVEYFRDRFKKLSGILRERGNAAKSIEAIKRRGQYDEVRVIGMVTSIATTKNGHRMAVIEDETDSLKVLVPKAQQDLIARSQTIINDEVLAFDGVLRKELFIANAFWRPDVPASREPNRAEEDICVALMSDTHVGSNLFLEKNFRKFLAWLNGSGSAAQRELAGKVKYLTIAGDLVDGVGIYPNQEDELNTENIFEQYRQLHTLLEQVPDYIEIIAIPGNHDAVRLADPQPGIPDELLGPLASMPNFHMMSSPAYCSLHGVELLMYHGASIHSIVPHVPNLNYDAPEKVVIEYLQRRHLHPVYGEKPPICPEPIDYMVVERVPDIMQVADVHRNGYVNYRKVIGVNAGTWQDITPYQVQKGHHPTPCILPLVNLHSGKLNILHFDKEVGA